MKSRLAAGLAAHGLAPAEPVLDALLRYLELVREGNQRAALVGNDDPAELVDRHLVDSAVFLPPLAATAARRVVDVGSGAGFPGLVLAVLDPALELTLVESRAKKVTFLEEAIERLGLPNVRVLAERAEVLGRDPDWRESWDAAVVRALAELAAAVEIVLPLVRPGGVALFAKGPRAAEEVERARRAIGELGGGEPSVSAYGSVPFHLVRVEKARPTPAAYPRRAGVAQKRPLT